jgi:hypothetical protein
MYEIDVISDGCGKETTDKFDRFERHSKAPPEMVIRPTPSDWLNGWVNGLTYAENGV